MNEKHTGYPEKKVIILLEDVDLLALEALNYAGNISDNIIAFSAVIKEEEETSLRSKWNDMHTDIPYIIKRSLVKSTGELILEYINSPEFSNENETVYLIVPLLIMKSRMQNFLNHSYIRHLTWGLKGQDNVIILESPCKMDKIS